MGSWIKAFLNNHDLIQTVSEWSLVDPLKKIDKFFCGSEIQDGYHHGTQFITGTKDPMEKWIKAFS